MTAGLPQDRVNRLVARLDNPVKIQNIQNSGGIPGSGSSISKSSSPGPGINASSKSNVEALDVATLPVMGGSSSSGDEVLLWM